MESITTVRPGVRRDERRSKYAEGNTGRRRGGPAEEAGGHAEGQKHIEVVGSYTQPQEALEELLSTRPDCAFLDIKMAGLNGIELAERLAAVNPDIEVVFITAFNYYATQAFEVNAIDYMLKPIRPERLDKAVDKLAAKIGVRLKKQEDCCQIQCFGGFRVTVGDKEVKWRRSKAKELMAYFLQNEGKWLSKYKLCDELWTEHMPERAVDYLQICLHAIRKGLRDAGCTQIAINYSGERYSMKVGTAAWDVKTFEEHYKVFCRSGSAADAQNALSRHRGEYLEGEEWLWAGTRRRVPFHV